MPPDPQTDTERRVVAAAIERGEPDGGAFDLMHYRAAHEALFPGGDMRPYDPAIDRVGVRYAPMDIDDPRSPSERLDR